MRSISSIGCYHWHLPILSSMIALFIGIQIYSTAFAGNPSLQRGKELFTGPSLGSNGQSCATCHPDGTTLTGVAELDQKELAAVINHCIRNAIKGSPLSPDSADMESLILYIRSLSSSNKEDGS